MGVNTDKLARQIQDQQKAAKADCVSLSFAYNDSVLKGRAFAKRTVTSCLRDFSAECNAA